MIALVVAGVALAVAVVALVLVVLVARQSGGVASTLERHRNAHVARDGTADPEPGGHRVDRRKTNLGPRRGTPERRGAPGQLTATPGQPSDPGGAPAADEPPTAAMPRLPRPGQIGRPR